MDVSLGELRESVMDGGTKLQVAMKTRNSQKEKKKSKEKSIGSGERKKKKTCIVTENI